ncbi:MAG TPA: NAD-dependent epimerase/dehydratase family protein, partial [Spirochaetota bacterium]|nr:NAD-dependent epimerase/dehydratase family protein [Spirochaetota bacterium]
MEFSGITLVTGAAGFMGSHVVEYLAGKGVRLRATARPRKDTSFFDNLGVEYVAADLTKPDTLPPLFDGDVDRVIHMGAICNFSTPFEMLYPTNVAGVDHITKLALDKGVKRFIHVSSTSLYGYYPNKPFTEDGERNPGDNYGKSKKAGEDVVFARIREGLPASIIRPCTVYGPRCNDGAGKVFSRPTVISAIPGNGKQLLSNIRAEDVAAAVYYISHRDETIGEVFNIAEDTNPTLEEALMIA